MDIVCKCGYEGDEVVQYETETPCKQIIDFTYGYRRVIKTIQDSKRTMTWACPKCGKVLVQQRGGIGYNSEHFDAMHKRLIRKTWDNRQYLRDLEKTKQSLKEANRIVGERHDKELERFQVPTAN